MKITCPRCDFSRDVPPEQLPARSVIATCPACSCRFRFSPDKGEIEILSDTATPAREQPTQPDNLGKDDPLPPDAIVPQSGGVSKDGLNEAEQEDTRLTASRAYRREASGFDDDAPSAADNPWETAPGENGWLAAFYQTVMRVMFASPRFFNALRPEAKSMRALVFYLIICVMQIVVERFWGDLLLKFMTPGTTADPQLEKLLAMLAPQASLSMTLLIRTGVLVLQLYFFTGLIHLTYHFLAPDKANFSLVFQVIAYSAAPSLLCVVPLLGSLAGLVWCIACVTTGCRSALQLTWGQTLTGFAPAILVSLFLLMQFLSGAKG
ncbi:MAG: zinc-ribbon domain-containing protein [Desulfovibrio sp.]|nr:zinc-ribbon domain-containing protein [Desulfovibrio sp.]